MMRALSDIRTAHDLAADWDWTEQAEIIGFRVKGGRVIWEDCEYVGYRVRVGRLLPTNGGIRAMVRFVDPDTEIEFVRRDANMFNCGHPGARLVRVYENGKRQSCAMLCDTCTAAVDKNEQDPRSAERF